MKIRSFATVVIMTVAALVPVGAAARTLDRRRAVRVALAQNPQIAAARAEEAAVEAQGRQVDAARWPLVTLTAGVAPSMAATLVPGTAAQSVESQYKDFRLADLRAAFLASLTVIQPLYTFGNIARRPEAVEHGLRAREAQTRMQRADVTSEVARIYEGDLLARDVERFFDEMIHLSSDPERQVAMVGGTPPLVSSDLVSAAQILALEARLDAVEARAEVAEARAEAAEQRPAVSARAEPVPSGSQTRAGEKGFVLRSDDGAYQLKASGLLAVDSRTYLQDTTLADSDAFLVRKIRPILTGTVLQIVDLQLILDFADSKITVFDAFADVRPVSWLKIRAGKLTAPIGLERWQIDPELTFMERSLAGNLVATRDVGVLLFAEGAGGLIQGIVGGLDGAPDAAMVDTDTNQGKDLVGRLRVQPLLLLPPRFGMLVLGVASSVGNHKGTAATDKTGLAVFRTPGQLSFFQYLTGATDPTMIVFADGQHLRVNPQLYYSLGPISLLAEYSFNRQSVHRGATVATLSHQAGLGIVSFVLGGKAGINGVQVNAPLDLRRGSLGALELAARYSEIRIAPEAFPVFADPAKSVAGARELGGSASWYAGRNLRVSANYEQTSFSNAAVAVSPVTRPTERAVLARTQVIF